MTPSDRIIVDGLLRVRPGVKVNPGQAPSAKPATNRVTIALPQAPRPREKAPGAPAPSE